jgi:hypothetical protein
LQKSKKNFPGRFARSVAPAVPQAPTDKSFLVLFFKKELLSSLTLRFTIQQSRACAFHAALQ